MAGLIYKPGEIAARGEAIYRETDPAACQVGGEG